MLACVQFTKSAFIKLIGFESAIDSSFQAAYYCIPASITSSAFQLNMTAVWGFDEPNYYNVWASDDKVVNVYFLTTHQLETNRMEMLLVSIMNTTTETTSLYVYTDQGNRLFLMQTRELQFDLMRKRTNHEFDTLNHVEVIAAYEDSSPT